MAVLYQWDIECAGYWSKIGQFEESYGLSRELVIGESLYVRNTDF